jgi:hypothetical protein
MKFNIRRSVVTTRERSPRLRRQHSPPPLPPHVSKAERSRSANKFQVFHHSPAPPRARTLLRTFTIGVCSANKKQFWRALLILDLFTPRRLQASHTYTLTYTFALARRSTINQLRRSVFGASKLNYQRERESAHRFAQQTHTGANLQG